jgi:hypothetical protein
MLFVSSGWRKKDLEIRRGNQLKYGMEKKIQANTPRGIKITTW